MENKLIIEIQKYHSVTCVLHICIYNWTIQYMKNIWESLTEMKKKQWGKNIIAWTATKLYYNIW